MSKHRILTDHDLARGVAGLGAEQFSVVYPEFNPGIGDSIRAYQAAILTVWVGGVRAAAIANDVKLILEELDMLRAQLAERNEGPRVSVAGGRLVIGRDGVATINGGKVTICGPARFAEVRP